MCLTEWLGGEGRMNLIVIGHRKSLTGSVKWGRFIMPPNGVTLSVFFQAVHSPSYSSLRASLQKKKSVKTRNEACYSKFSKKSININSSQISWKSRNSSNLTLSQSSHFRSVLPQITSSKSSRPSSGRRRKKSKKGNSLHFYLGNRNLYPIYVNQLFWYFIL